MISGKLLKKYIRKVVEKRLFEKLNEDGIKTIFLKRLEKIPLEKQEELFLHEIHILSPYSIHSPLFNKQINEEKLSLPLDKVKEIIKKEYNFNDWQFLIRTLENNVDIAILIPNTQTYIDKLTEDMTTLGYFCSFMQNITYNGFTYKAMRFEPLYQPNIREKEIGDNVLYHITPLRNVENIKKEGLKPLSNNKYFNYPNRVYFLKSNNTAKEIREIARGFHKSNEDDEDYVLIVIDLNRVPVNVAFHNDPSLANAVYTYDRIPSSSIVNVIELHINQ